MSDTKLPMSVEEITAEWLGQALGTEISELEVDNIVWGTATKVVLEARHDADLPSRFCIKGGFTEELRPVMGAGYVDEARFYRDLAPQLGEGLPTVYFADEDEEAQQGIVVMEDLGAKGATFVDAAEPITVEQVRRGLEIQAGWHSMDDPGYAWLKGEPNIRNLVRGVLTPEAWDAQIGQAEPGAVADTFRSRERTVEAFEAMWAIDDEQPPVLCHHDANPTNVYLDADGQPNFIDWQFAALGEWAYDVALFMVGALSTEDRRAHEEELLRGYLDARGAGAPSFDDAWDAYRRHHLTGVLYTLTPEEMQPKRVRLPLADRYAQAAVDHDTVALLLGDS